MAHLPDALLALTFRHPCLPSPMGKQGSKAKLLKISRKADRDAPCDQARMLDSVRTEVVSTDAYKWSNRVGARCTDHTRPQMQRCRAHQAYTTLHRGEGVGVRDREFVLLIKKIDFFDKLSAAVVDCGTYFCLFGFTEPQNLLREALLSPVHRCLL